MKMDFRLISYFYKKIIMVENVNIARVNVSIWAQIALQVVEKYDKSLL